MAIRSKGNVSVRGAIGEIYPGHAGQTFHASSVHDASVNSANPFAISSPGDVERDGARADLDPANSANFHSACVGGA